MDANEPVPIERLSREECERLKAADERARRALPPRDPQLSYAEKRAAENIVELLFSGDRKI